MSKLPYSELKTPGPALHHFFSFLWPHLLHGLLMLALPYAFDPVPQTRTSLRVKSPLSGPLLLAL